MKKEISLTGFGLLLCFIITPFGDFKLMGRSINLYFYILFFIFWLYEVVLQKRKIITFKRINWAFLIFFLFQMISEFWAYNSSTTAEALNNFLKVGLLIVLATSINYSQKEISLFKRCYYVSVITLCIYMLFGNASAVIGEQGRTTLDIAGSVTEVNYLSYLFIIPLIVGMEEILGENKAIITRLLFGAGNIFILYSMLTTGSRGGILAAAISILSFVILKIINDGLSPKILFVFLSGTAILVIILPKLLVLLPENLISRYALSEFLWSSGGSGRTTIWKNALDVVFNRSSIFRLLFGYGYLGSGAYFGYTMHNIFIEILFDCGVLGLVMLVRMIYLLLINSLNFRDSFCGAALVGVVVLSLSLAAVISRHFWIGVLFLMCCLCNTDTRHKVTYFTIGYY